MVALITSSDLLEHHKARQQNSCALSVQALGPGKSDHRDDIHLQYSPAAAAPRDIYSSSYGVIQLRNLNDGLLPERHSHGQGASCFSSNNKHVC